MKKFFFRHPGLDPGSRLPFNLITRFKTFPRFPDLYCTLDLNDKGAESQEAQLFYRGFTLFKKGLKQQKYNVF
jgi:hypothetical protein